MSVINTNYLALVSQSHLQKSQSALGTAIERLSSGLRINSAKDDAAGFAIAERFLSNIRGLSQVARDTSYGVSLAQTAQGALSATNDSLHRQFAHALQHIVHGGQAALGHLRHGDGVAGVAHGHVHAAHLGVHAVGNGQAGGVVLGAVDAQAR